MTHPDDDDAIDALLRRQFAGPVPDDGFTARVMQRIPARRRGTTWPAWIGVLSGTGLGGWALQSSPLLQAGWRDWLGNAPSLPAMTLLLAAGSVALLAMLWAVMEAEDR